MKLSDYALKGLLLVSVATSLISLYYRSAFYEERVEGLMEIQERLEDQLDSVVYIYEQNRQQTLDLLNAQQAIRKSLTGQQQETRRLQSEVQEIKEWAGGLLPADIVRLRQRPALTGVSAYSERLSSSDTMRVEPQQPEN